MTVGRVSVRVCAVSLQLISDHCCGHQDCRETLAADKRTNMWNMSCACDPVSVFFTHFCSSLDSSTFLSSSVSLFL